jgi:hypothetical protein
MTDLVLNPRAELVIDRRAGEIRAVTLRAPTRQRGLQITRVTTDDPPAVFEVLCRVAEGRAVDVDLEDGEVDKLASMGLLVPNGQAPQPVLLRCPIDGAARGHHHQTSGSLVVNPTLRFRDEIGPPEEAWVAAESVRRQRGAVRGDARINPFARDCAWASVQNEGFVVPTPLSIEEADRPLFRRLSPGRAAPADLDAQTSARLHAAGVLVDPDEESKQRAIFDDTRAEGRQSFAKARFALLRDLVFPAFVAALRRHYRALVAEGYTGYDDTLGRNRHWLHNEPVARVLHGALTELVSEVVGEPMKPSYVYFASYRRGALLVPHTDRKQCPVTVSLLVDYVPDPEGPSPWPLYLDLDEGSLPVLQRLGDGLLFDGTRIRHHRPALPEGHESTSLFFHYVPIDFAGDLD